MRLTPAVRYAIPAALLVLLYASYLTYQRASESLLTPAPTSLVPVVIVLALILGIGSALLLLEGVRSRLLRRLGTVALMAVVIYLSGVAGRGFYATHAFPAGQITHATSHWLVVGSSGNAINAVRQDSNRRTSRQFPAEAEALPQAKIGYCFDRPVERSSSGAERLATAEHVAASDLRPCASALR